MLGKKDTITVLGAVLKVMLANTDIEIYLVMANLNEKHSHL